MVTIRRGTFAHTDSPTTPCVLLTGGTGFLGGAVLHQLLVSVVCVDEMANANVVLVARAKRGRSARERVESLLNRLAGAMSQGLSALEGHSELGHHTHGRETMARCDGFCFELHASGVVMLSFVKWLFHGVCLYHIMFRRRRMRL